MLWRSIPTRRKLAIRQLVFVACCLLGRIPLAFPQSHSTTVPQGTVLSDPDCYTAVTTTLTPKTLSAAIHINSATDTASLRATEMVFGLENRQATPSWSKVWPQSHRMSA